MTIKNAAEKTNFITANDKYYQVPYTVHCLFGLHDTFYTELLFMRNMRRYFAMMWPEILDVYKYIIDYSDFIVHAGKAT